MGGARPASAHLSRLHPPSRMLDEQSNDETFNSDGSIIIRAPHYSTTFWASSPRPVSHQADFALATSHGTILVTEAQNNWCFDWCMGFANVSDAGGKGKGPDREVLVVEWLSENVVASGCRDRSVRLWDVRSRGLEAISRPFVHGSVINHVRKVDDNRILVVGIEHQMAVYDLRFLKAGRKKGQEVTDPFVRFLGYKNKDRGGLDVGCDVWRDGGLVAVGMEDESVGIFELGTGGEMDAGRGGELGKKKLGGLARCVKFVDGKDGLRLMIAAGGWIQEWAWQRG